MELLLRIVAGLLLAWLILALVLLAARPRGGRLGEFLHLLPDTLGLFRALIRDPQVSGVIKLRLWLLLAYLALPIDLVPDFVPVIGYADDAIVTAVVLRSVVRGAGREKVSEHWPGTEDGLSALLRFTGISIRAK